MEVVTHLFHIHVLFAGFPDVGEVSVQQVEGGRSARLIASYQHGRLAAKRLVDDA